MSFARSKFIFWHLVALVAIKALVPIWGWQLAAISQESVYSAQEVVDLTNQYRASEHVPTLRESVTLNVAAAQKLQDMIENQYFAHVSPSGVTPWHWFDTNQYRYSYAGENLAIGFPDARSTIDAWADSPSHRRNLVQPNYQEIGVAVARVKIHDIEGVLVVQLFGTQIKATKGESLGVSFSGSQAQEITSTPTPMKDAREAPIVPIQVSSTEREQPQVVEKTPSGGRPVALLDTSFLIYTFIVAAIAIGYVAYRGLNRRTLTNAAIQTAIFLLAALIPPLELIRRALIN
ncbi:MAG: CAP domain-containing protein [Candidatus Yanofskybacteria bacterium]|nr:CAP domain-containing protein [Candidatus Yanofskybacteria bacterium]